MKAHRVCVDLHGPHERVDEYEGFNLNPSSADFIIAVDNDLAVGPFYCYEESYVVAKKELARYMKEQWDRGVENVRFYRISK